MDTGSFTMKCAKVKAYITLNIDLQFQNQTCEPPLHRDIYEHVKQISLSQMAQVEEGQDLQHTSEEKKSYLWNLFT